MHLEPVALDDPHVPAHNIERDEINNLRLDVDKRMLLPNSPGLGALLRWDGDNWVPSKMRLFEGEGSPEGVVSAPPGSRYVDTTAASGSSEWWKQGGEGTEGWATLNSGTGWQNITLGPGFSYTPDNPGQVSSLNGVTYFRGAVRRTAGSGIALGSIPEDLAPRTFLSSSVRAGNDEGMLYAISPSGALTISSLLTNNVDVYLGAATGTPYRR